MKGLPTRYRLIVSGMLALFLHTFLLLQQLSNNNIPPRIIQEYRNITISLNSLQPEVKQAVKQIVKRKKQPQPKALVKKIPPRVSLTPEKLPKVKPSIKPIAEKKEVQPIKRHFSQVENQIAPVQTAMPQISTPKAPKEAITPSDKETKEAISKPELISNIRKATPIYQNNPLPKYPRLAKVRGYEGVVIVEALVDIIGRTKKVRISASSGYRILDKAALKSVRGWQFTPGSIAGKPEKMWVKMPVRFRLESPK